MVNLLDKYLSLLPPTAPYFYMKAKENFPSDLTVGCFINQRVEIDQLKKMLPELSEKAGIGIRYTNHSLCTTTITRMFNGEIDEKIIPEASGHRNLKVLRAYEAKATKCKRGDL